MTPISREQLHVLVETAARRPLRGPETTILRDGLTACYTAIDHMEKQIAELVARAADYEQVIRSQRRELLKTQEGGTP
jgi:hypothetical protein